MSRPSTPRPRTTADPAGPTEFEQQLTRALQARAAHPGLDAVTARLGDQWAARKAGLEPAAQQGEHARPALRGHRARGAVAAGLLAGTIAVAGGAVAAASPTPVSEGAAAVHQWLVDLGADTSSMPEGYTVEQYEAFWGAGYTVADREALEELWHTDATETKARAGQMLIDGQQVPVAPSDPEVTTVRGRQPSDDPR